MKIMRGLRLVLLVICICLLIDIGSLLFQNFVLEQISNYFAQPKLKETSNEITAVALNDTDKIIKIVEWERKNINFQEGCTLPTIFSGNCIYPPWIRYHGDKITPLNLVTRRGACQEFAVTFVSLARASGLEARPIFHRRNHAWAQVYLNGSWRDINPSPPDTSPIFMNSSELQDYATVITTLDSNGNVIDITDQYTNITSLNLVITDSGKPLKNHEVSVWYYLKGTGIVPVYSREYNDSCITNDSGNCLFRLGGTPTNDIGNSSYQFIIVSEGLINYKWITNKTLLERGVNVTMNLDLHSYQAYIEELTMGYLVDLSLIIVLFGAIFISKRKKGKKT